jgi:hypothetical protein
LKDILRSIWGRLFADFRKYWWVPAILLGYYLIVQKFFTASCPIYQTIGIPCAGCGMTRAARFVLTGQFSRAFYLNPLAFFVVAFVLYCIFYRYIKGKAVPHFVKGIVVILILLFLFYIVRMVLYFPDRVPYVYNYHNTLEGIIPGYRGFMRRLLRF